MKLHRADLNEDLSDIEEYIDNDTSDGFEEHEEITYLYLILFFKFN